MAIDEPNEDYEDLAPYQEALAAAQTAGDRAAEIEVLINLSRYCAWSKARQKYQYYRQAIAIAQEMGDRSAEAEVLKHIGMFHEGLKQNRPALRAFHQAFAIYQEIGERRGQINMLDFLQQWHDRRGETEQALAYCQQALVIARTETDSLSREMTLTDKLVKSAYLYRQQGEFAQAQAASEELVSIAKVVANPRREAFILRRLGEFYQSQNQLDRALNFYQDALSSVRGTCDQAIALIRIAEVYQQQGQFDRALAAFQEALAASRAGEPFWELSLLRSIAYLYESQGNADQAEQYHQQADAIDPG